MGLLLSPRSTETIEIESSDEENVPAKRPIAGRKSLRKQHTPPMPSPPKNDPPSDDYGMDMDTMDDGFLEELQKAEEKHKIPTAPRPIQSTSGRRQVNPEVEVITINDEDDDMEDKENVPAPQRHVRRRVFGEVIELSDSD